MVSKEYTRTLTRRADHQLMPPLYRKAPSIGRGLRSTGQPLDAATRADLEPRFGHDFSGVRVHTGDEAAESAQAVSAQAYTVGQDVVFGSGRYRPATASGRHLLAHELVHVVQQARGGATAHPERQAEEVAAGVIGGGRQRPTIGGVTGPVLQRQPDSPASQPGAGNSEGAGSGWSTSLDGFAHNGAALTGIHRSSIEALASEIAARVGAGSRATISVSGHTDTSGDEKYNEELGLKRATAAKASLEAALSAKGVGSDRLSTISAISAGESHLAVPTADGVREPRNRRVLITVAVDSPVPAPAPSPDAPPPEKKKIDINLPPDYRLPEEDWWNRTQREIDKIKEYDRTHPRRTRSLTDVLVEGVTRALEPIIKELPESLRGKARDGIRKGIEAGTEKACEAAIDASGVSGSQADAIKSACKAALKSKPGESK